MVDISVTNTPDGLMAEPNPPVAQQGEEVNWVFSPELGNVSVVFKRVELANGNLLTSEQGPFKEPLSPGPPKPGGGITLTGTIAADVPNGRYLCEIHNNSNQNMNWAPAVGNSQNMAGLEIPRTPPF